MIMLGTGYLGEISESQNTIGLGLNRGHGTKAVAAPFRTIRSIHGKLGELFVRIGSQTEKISVGTGILYYKNGTIEVHKKSRDHSFNPAGVTRFAGEHLTLYAQMK